VTSGGVLPLLVGDQRAGADWALVAYGGRLWRHDLL
jgi:hypothetical protein